MAVACAWCGAVVTQPTGNINRALRNGRPVYCDRFCSGYARRVPAAERRRRKAAYDSARRAEKADELRAQKAAYYQATRPARLEKFADRRASEAGKAYHRAYCRQPDYVAAKATYDRQYRAVKDYGPEFAEAALVLGDLQRDIDDRASRDDIYQQNGTLNKAQNRKRALKWT